jgi:ParB family transcriptional regulator, chromosome partitioning protein
VTAVADSSPLVILGELGAAVEAMKSVPWTTLQELKGDEMVLKKLDEAETLLRSLRKALTSE